MIPVELVAAAEKLLRIVKKESHWNERQYGEESFGQEIAETESALALYEESP